MKRDLIVFVTFMVLLILSELLISVNGLIGTVFYSFWLLVLIVILTTKFLGNRNLFIALTTLPLIRIVSLLMPIEGVVNYIFVVYIIIFIIALMCIYNLKIRAEERNKSKSYLFLLLPLFGVSFLKYKLVQPTNVVMLSYETIALTVFASITYILLFMYVIQNSLEKGFGFKGVVFTGILMTAIGFGSQNIIGIGLTLLISLSLALIYSESRNWYLIAGLLSFLNVMTLIVLPFIRWF